LEYDYVTWKPRIYLSNRTACNLNVYLYKQISYKNPANSRTFWGQSFSSWYVKSKIRIDDKFELRGRCILFMRDILKLTWCFITLQHIIAPSFLFFFLCVLRREQHEMMTSFHAYVAIDNMMVIGVLMMMMMMIFKRQPS